MKQESIKSNGRGYEWNGQVFKSWSEAWNARNEAAKAADEKAFTKKRKSLWEGFIDGVIFAAIFDLF